MKHKKAFLIGFCLIISFVCLSLGSKNSPLYVFNDWVDENAFFTMGRGWLAGLLPYRDLFEQKGPLLYLLFAIAAFFSNHSFIGVFFLEIVSLTITLYYGGKICALFLEEKASFYLLPLFAALLVSCPAFVQGGSAEEFCFPMLMISLFHFLCFLKKDQAPLPNTTLFVDGLLAGAIAMIKYNLLGFHFMYMALICYTLLRRKEIKKLFQQSCIFLLGMSCTILPFILYFLGKGALTDFFNAYFLYNIAGYSNGVKIPLLLKGGTIIGICAYRSFQNIFIFPFITAFFISIFKSKLFKKGGYLLLLAGFLLLTIYFGLIDLRYYILPFFLFSLLGLIFLYQLVITSRKSEKLKGRFLFSILLSLGLLFTSPNLKTVQMKKEDFAQFHFAEIMKQEPNPTLLNYHFLDGGFYTASGILPTVRYFERQNGTKKGLKENLWVQDKAIREQRVDFVVTRRQDKRHHDTSFLNRYYEPIASFKQPLEHHETYYQLWKKRSFDSSKIF